MTDSNMLHVVAIDTTRMHQAYGVAVARLFDLLPVTSPAGFGAALVEVPQGGSGMLHAHEDHELWLVLDGAGWVEAPPERHELRSGALIYIPPHREHRVHSSEGRALRLISMWWIDRHADEVIAACP